MQHICIIAKPIQCNEVDIIYIIERPLNFPKGLLRQSAVLAIIVVNEDNTISLFLIYVRSLKVENFRIWNTEYKVNKSDIMSLLTGFQNYGRQFCFNIFDCIYYWIQFDTIGYRLNLNLQEMCWIDTVICKIARATHSYSWNHLIKNARGFKTTFEPKY